MNKQLLLSLGLSESQAKTYSYLLVNGPQTPPEIAKNLCESRTNTYNVLSQLSKMKLVSRYDKGKKLVYQAEPPTSLEGLALKQKEKILDNERQLKASMSSLLSSYFSSHQKPGVSFFRGKSEIKNIYLDQIKTKEPIYIVRPNYETDLYNFDYMSELRHAARRAGIKRYAITPDLPKAPANHKESDPFMLLNRTWIKATDYTAPVEWNVYGNKLAILSFDKEVIGVIVESPQIAESFRQLYNLMAESIKSRPDYKNLPVEAAYMGSTKKSNPELNSQ